MDRQQRDEEEKTNIIKMLRELKVKGLYNSVGVVIKHHGYIVLDELIK
ncbi:hypothetical protein [Bacillus thuringiensis]|nr:hypothetical protein [Bacillus thuringiensis]MDY8166058.1 hypothetical protein [Bacillus thuringiensis]